MKQVLLLILALGTFSAFAIPCDCEVRVYSPMTGSHQLQAEVLKVYTLEGYASYSVKNQRQCRNTCLSEFEKDYTVEKLHGALLSYTRDLIQEKKLGFNCTGLTTVKFPVRVKASLGLMGLGNVSDTIEVVTHEEVCF